MLRLVQEHKVSAPSFRSGIETGQGTALPAPTFKNTACSDVVLRRLQSALQNFQKQDMVGICLSLTVNYVSFAERQQLGSE